LNGLSYNFTAAPNSNDNSRVNIGNAPCGLNFPSRLSVIQSELMPSAILHTAIVGYTDATAYPIDTPVYGIMGIVSTTHSFRNAGVYGRSQNAYGDYEAIGVFGVAANSDRNIGVYGRAQTSNANRNVGVYGEATGAIDVNYGVWGVADTTNTLNRAGYFVGDLEYTGQFIQPSDQNLKKNILPLENADSILQLLEPKIYEYKVSDYPQLSLSTGVKMGFIAQDVEPILPQSVKNSYRAEVRDSLGNLIYPEVSYKSLSNEDFIPLLVAGYKDQQKIVNKQDSLINVLMAINTDLNSRLTTLETCVNNSNLCNKKVKKSLMEENEEANTNSHTTEITLTDLQYIVLDQNVPNPFAEQTSIGYFLPEDIKKAQVVFHNADGKLINSLMITERGRGSLNVYADDLSSGVYSYTLIADGKVIDTKRMVKN
jgi:hypothetical protein